MDTIKQFSVFVENQQGKLAELTRLIADAGIDLRSLSLADTRDFGILRLIVNQPEAAEKLLNENGWTFKVTDVVGVKVPDQPGGVAAVLEALNEAGVNVEYMYAFVNPTPGIAITVLRVDHDKKCIETLKKCGIEILTPAEAYALR
jgi:hypothetical protein